jgi:coenzyme F420-reducing hydrogenase delta subunit
VSEKVIKPFEPKILAFLCNWCAYAGADLAGISRFQYPPNIRVIRVMCSGRVDPVFILEGFMAGFDGVMVLGCHPGDCHYLSGNYQCENRIRSTEKLFRLAGFNQERLYLDWVSAGEGQRFAELVDQFVNKIKGLDSLRINEFLIRQLQAIKGVLERERFRWLMGKGQELVEKGNVYGEKVSQEEFDEVVNEARTSEYWKNMISLTLKEEPLTTEEIAKNLGIDVKNVYSYIVELLGENSLGYAPGHGNTPKYIAMR